MRACVVGCGQVAGWHSHKIRKNFEEVHFVDTRVGFAKQLCGQGHSYSAKIPDERFDLGVVCTPNGTHREVAEHFISRGIAVFVEKPIALRMEDILWFEEQERQGAWITVGYQARYSAAVKSVLNHAECGQIISADCTKFRARSEDYYDGYHGTWAMDGGVIAQQAAHCVDLVCALGEPKSAYMIGRNVKHAIECEDTATVIIGFDGWDATVRATTAMDVNGGTSFQVLTNEGVVSAAGGQFNKIVGWQSPYEQVHGHDKMWAVVRRCLQESEPSPLTAREAAKSIKAIHAAYVSMLEHRPAEYGEECKLLGR